MAVKKVPVRSEVDAAREVNTMRAIATAGGHPNVVKLLDVFSDKGSLLLVLELRDAALNEWLKLRPLVELGVAHSLSGDLWRGLAFLRDQGILHRDLKPANTLLTHTCLDGARPQLVLKISDFGSSILLSPSASGQVSPRELTPARCSIWWAAPEVLAESTVYTSAVDVWGGGCIMAELLSGRRAPFQGEDRFAVHEAIRSLLGDPPESFVLKRPPPDLQSALLEVPVKRVRAVSTTPPPPAWGDFASCAQCCVALRHPERAAVFLDQVVAQDSPVHPVQLFSCFASCARARLPVRSVSVHACARARACALACALARVRVRARVRVCARSRWRALPFAFAAWGGRR